ncbi:MAG: dihydrolipoyl dehydrogenase [Candidatus Aureabacteria bacterium]|nr:dihydrolipoyl dehydrogenase [Candidatus Auribacterota bacterium]
MTVDYELLILGSGPAGYVGAVKAAESGIKKIAVLEKETLGGVCLNRGCIPSKSLIHQATVFRSIQELEFLGVKTDPSGLDYSKVFLQSRKAVDNLRRGIEFLFKKHGIELIHGDFRLHSSNEVISTEGTILSFNNLLIASGSKPKDIPGFPIDETTVLSSTGALNLNRLPKKALVLGSGAIGLELAYIWNSFGVDVHVIEMLDRILPQEEEETTRILQKIFEKRNVRFSCSTKAVEMNKTGKGVEVILESRRGRIREETELILIAAGRIPATDNLALEKAGIQTEKGFIPVGDFYRTSSPHIYAAGDVLNSPLLAHVASREATIAVQAIAGKTPQSKINPELIPSCIYTEPQIAGFGFTEQKAKEQNLPVKKSVYYFKANGLAVATGSPEGLIKILWNQETRQILGSHLVGKNATELIHELLLAASAKLNPHQVKEMIHAHPTLSEGIMEVMEEKI